MSSCDKCHDTGKVTCPECGGEKKVECPVCGGHGEFDCDECDSTGMVECEECDGSGKEISICPVCSHGKITKSRWINCDRCHGKGEWKEGYVRCPNCGHENYLSTAGAKCFCGYYYKDVYEDCEFCDGRGQVEEKYDEICPNCHGEYRRKTDKSCGTCVGTGKVECSRCNGTGHAKCGKCGGTGKVECGTCSGKGEIRCPDCEQREKEENEKLLTEEKRRIQEKKRREDAEKRRIEEVRTCERNVKECKKNFWNAVLFSLRFVGWQIVIAPIGFLVWWWLEGLSPDSLPGMMEQLMGLSHGVKDNLALSMIISGGLASLLFGWRNCRWWSYFKWLGFRYRLLYWVYGVAAVGFLIWWHSNGFTIDALHAMYERTKIMFCIGAFALVLGVYVAIVNVCEWIKGMVMPIVWLRRNNKYLRTLRAAREKEELKAHVITSNRLYCIVDLSAGSKAASYPVSYMAQPPKGGFNADEYKTTKLVLRGLEAGAFTMGDKDEDDNPPHKVTLTTPFYCGIFQVTQKQYELVMGENPSSYKGDKRPVENVSYDMIRGTSNGALWPEYSVVDVSSFIGKLRARTELNFDLPTEAQWEYACRAGTTSNYNNGGRAENDLKKLGRYDNNRTDGKGGFSEHAIVGSYMPNAWGLYDMHGNVWEWCLDRFQDLSSRGEVDPVGSASGGRVLRGGSWCDGARRCRSANRLWFGPDFRSYAFGFRLCCSAGPRG